MYNIKSLSLKRLTYVFEQAKRPTQSVVKFAKNKHVILNFKEIQQYFIHMDDQKCNIFLTKAFLQPQRSHLVDLYCSNIPFSVTTDLSYYYSIYETPEFTLVKLTATYSLRAMTEFRIKQFFIHFVVALVLLEKHIR